MRIEPTVRRCDRYPSLPKSFALLLSPALLPLSLSLSQSHSLWFCLNSFVCPTRSFAGLTSERGCWIASRGSNSHLAHFVRLAHDLVGCSLHDTSRLGEHGRGVHEVGIDVASGLTAFVDAPMIIAILASNA